MTCSDIVCEGPEKQYEGLSGAIKALMSIHTAQQSNQPDVDFQIKWTDFNLPQYVVPNRLFGILRSSRFYWQHTYQY